MSLATVRRVATLGCVISALALSGCASDPQPPVSGTQTVKTTQAPNAPTVTFEQALAGVQPSVGSELHGSLPSITYANTQKLPQSEEWQNFPMLGAGAIELSPDVLASLHLDLSATSYTMTVSAMTGTTRLIVGGQDTDAVIQGALELGYTEAATNELQAADNGNKPVHRWASRIISEDDNVTVVGQSTKPDPLAVPASQPLEPNILTVANTRQIVDCLDDPLVAQVQVASLDGNSEFVGIGLTEENGTPMVTVCAPGDAARAEQIAEAINKPQGGKAGQFSNIETSVEGNTARVTAAFTGELSLTSVMSIVPMALRDAL